MRLKIEMQADIRNLGNSKIKGLMTWHLFTDMDNQFVELIDVFPAAKVEDSDDKNMVAKIKIPELSPGERFSPTAILRIDTTTRDWLMEPHETPKQTMSRNRGEYCKMQKYWETQDEMIQEIAQKSAEKTGDDESYARLVFDTVRESVKLKTHLEERRGAARAIREKEGDCDEHADLLIALLRAVKIPARRIVGHYYQPGNDTETTGHAWCEVYLQNKGWIPVDPALGNFGTMSENYYSRIREGSISERRPIRVELSVISSKLPSVEEEVKMSIVQNGRS